MFPKRNFSECASVLSNFYSFSPDARGDLLVAKNHPTRSRIVCFYEYGPDGENAVRYARELCSHLGLTKLFVALPSEPDSQLVELDLLQVQRVREGVARIARLDSSLVDLVRFDSSSNNFCNGDLVVCSKDDDRIDECNRLITFDEVGPSRALDGFRGPIILPFGNGESGRTASRLALLIAKQLGLEIVFYHTTWRSDCGSDDPRLNMCESAHALCSYLETTARSLGIRHQVRVEMADDIVEGLIRFGMRCNASMIAMSRGLSTAREGSYVTRTLASSPIPVLLSGRRENNDE